MQREPYLSVFWSSPRYDLKLSVNEDEDGDNSEERRPWPDLELLFGKDDEYGAMIDRISVCVNHNIDSVSEFTKVSVFNILYLWN